MCFLPYNYCNLCLPEQDYKMTCTSKVSCSHLFLWGQLSPSTAVEYSAYICHEKTNAKTLRILGNLATNYCPASKCNAAAPLHCPCNYVFPARGIIATEEKKLNTKQLYVTLQRQLAITPGSEAASSCFLNTESCGINQVLITPLGSMPPHNANIEFPLNHTTNSSIRHPNAQQGCDGNPEKKETTSYQNLRKSLLLVS